LGHTGADSAADGTKLDADRFNKPDPVPTISFAQMGMRNSNLNPLLKKVTNMLKQLN
jgi:hypothetical protein